MRDSRGVNRMVDVLNSGIETGSSSNLVPKSTPVDASVLKERNTNDTNDPTRAFANDAKDSKPVDARECKLNAQSASELTIKRSVSHQSGDDSINLDLDEIDYDDKCAKALTSEGDNDSQNALSMDVDEPSENLYVEKNASNNQYERSTTKADENADDPVAIDSEEESNKSNAPHENTIIVNGISKGSSSAEEADKRTKSGDNAANVTIKSNKRKISISSDEERPPPAKKWIFTWITWFYLDFDF